MAQLNSRAASLFVSYSHKDEKYRARLHEALSTLQRRGLVREWFDGRIVPGRQFEPEIFEHLSKSEIIVLLLSPSYMSSDYCWNKELWKAFQLQQERDLRVVGVVIRPVHLTGTELLQHKLLPKDRKPVTLWRPQDLAWENVCVGLEEVIADLNHPSQVDDALNVPKAVFEAASARQSEGGENRPAPPYPLKDISDFWNRRGSSVKPNGLVCVDGTFSQFAPMLVGPPNAKRHLHKSFRQMLEGDEKLRRRKGASLDACLSVSAGQMVWRFRQPGSAHICYGLYNSIVRNSILVLVTEEYHRTQLEPLFQSLGRKTFEARLTGRVIPLDNSPVKEFVQKHAGSFIPRKVVDELCRDVYGLLVDGHGTSVQRIGEARYLDGDIWIAVESEGRERFLTSFLDVGNPAERKMELAQLFGLAKALPGCPRVFAQYDDGREFTPRPGRASPRNQFLNAIWRLGSGP